MDLLAYAQIENLENIAKENGIEVPRLRGYRLMRDEEPLTQEEINRIKRDCEVGVAEELCTADPFWNPHANSHTFSYYTDYLRKYYLVYEKEPDGYIRYTSIRWDRIHGKKRKILKFEIKKAHRRIQKQYDMWNKYAGQNVLYIHARIGGYNWLDFGGNELEKQPWFLEHVDDWWDGTYCDIYSKIKEEN